jgi:POT family proton-dependent oligopeptide transporter
VKIALIAPAVEGRANDACIVFMAKLFHVPRASVTIAAGERARRKTVHVGIVRRHGAGSSRRRFETEQTLSFGDRLREIRTGFDRPFWVANITELFERLSYYAAFASLARYLNESLQFPVERASTLTGWFGFSVWFLAAFGGALADRMGFRRALSLAYLILSIAYFLLGSIGAAWLEPLRIAVPLGLFVGVILFLPSLGVALVKPSVVGTTARASNENVRSVGYSIYYTLVNVGSALGTLMASRVQANFSASAVFLAAAVSVFLMFFAVLIFFKEPRRAGEVETTSLAQAGRNFLTVLGNPRFMLFLLIFSGYWVVFWQEFTTLPIYIVKYVDPNADTAAMLTAGPIVVILFTVAFNLLMQKISAFHAITLGTLISGLAWVILAIWPSFWMAVVTIVVVAIGEITQSPRYYEYISRLAPSGQQGTYLGFAFVPIGIGSLIGGKLGGWLLHYFGEVQGQPGMTWWAIAGVGVLTALLLWVYDRTLRPAVSPAAGT